MELTFEQRCFKDMFEQYHGRLKEIKMLERQIDKLLKKKERLPVVKDKVRSSMDEFPYIETHVAIDALEPFQATTIERLIFKKRAVIAACNAEALKVQDYIANIPDTVTRQAFYLVYVEGKTQKAAAKEMGYTQSRISKLLKAEFLKHS